MHTYGVFDMIKEMILAYLPPPFQTNYIVAAIVFVGFIILSKIFVYIVEKIVQTLTSRTQWSQEDA